METLFIASGIIIIAGLIFLFLLHKQRQKLGVLGKAEITSIDSEKLPATLLRAESIPLVGKPDYLIRQDDTLMPVEIKTGRTPRSPYPGHVMQLMAYCYLLEQTYNTRPPGGILKYPDKEFKIAYTSEAQRSVELVVNEILTNKHTNKEYHCAHKEHYLNRGTRH